MSKKFEVVVTRTEPVLISPASETPKGEYFLSNLDQNIAIIVKTLYYFKSETKSNQESVDVIKKSLSEILVDYYPVAGRLMINSEGKLAVNCTGEGVVVVAAEANCGIEKIQEAVLENKMEILENLVFDLPDCRNILEIPPVVAQVTNFKCGGFVLGLSMSHNMFDGVSAMEFLNSWSQTARGIRLSLPPFLNRSILRSRIPPKIEFPHNEFDDIKDISNTQKLYQDEDLIYKSFIFDEIKLEKLKTMAIEGQNRFNFTTFQTLTGFLWKSRCKALGFKPDQPVKLLFAADGRSRFVPRLPEGYFGNGIVLTGLVTSAGDLESNPLSHSVGLVKESVELVTDRFMKSVIDHFEVNRKRPSLTATLLITSWANLKFNTQDFGWGEPVFSGPVGLPGKEVILFLPRGDGNMKKGVNVFLGLPASAMNVFEELMKI